jgi:hypothetical protein
MNRLALFWFGHWVGPVLIGACFLLAALVLAVFMWSPAVDEKRPAALADLVAEIAAGRPEAVSQAKSAAARDWPAAAPVVWAMLGHDEPQVRAAACIILADHLDASGLAAVLPRASDADWRVRMAAFQALSAAQPLGGEVLRDTPLDERETLLLQWLDAYDAKCGTAGLPSRGLAPATVSTAGQASRATRLYGTVLGSDLCELYAADRHLEFGRPLTDRCLACHAGAEPAPYAANDVCAGCHAAACGDWAASAHGQSLSHLRLATVNAATRQPEAMSFGEVRGIGCRECHRVEKEPAAPLSKDATGLAACPFRFRPDQKPADSCRRCHASTAAEWQTWLKGPQPRIATWPPGQIETDRSGDTRTCVDCHMPPDPAGGEKPARSHTWAARRDVQRLREGVSATLTVTRGVAAPTLSLINLAGHAYPTGTRRRALRILAGPPGDEAPAVVADLSPVRPGRRLFAALPALAPGEQRGIAVPAASGAPAVVCRLRYCRDASDPQALVVEIFQAEQDLRPWAGPQGTETPK